MTSGDVWKKFDESGLTHSSIHHLFAIHDLRKEYGYARAVDVANYLDISRASVSITLNKLKDRGFVGEDDHKCLVLSERGKKQVNAALSKRRIIDRFFREVLALPARDAKLNACKIEHLISRDAGHRLIKFMSYFLAENDTAQKFRSGLKKHKFDCQNTEECDICEQNCYIREA